MTYTDRQAKPDAEVDLIVAEMSHLQQLENRYVLSELGVPLSRDNKEVGGRALLSSEYAANFVAIETNQSETEKSAARHRRKHRSISTSEVRPCQSIVMFNLKQLRNLKDYAPLSLQAHTTCVMHHKGPTAFNCCIPPYCVGCLRELP